MSENSRLIIIKNFYSKELNNSRNIRIYLPKSYDKSYEKRYPVLYMHDGQNLFNGSDNTWIASWNMDRTVDKLVAEYKMPEIIVVGIDNNEDRGNEYCHFNPQRKYLGRMGSFENQREKNPKGLLYEKFIIESVKPYIDICFRTLSDRNNTGLMGSSLGGLVTYFIGMHHPDVFGKLGILSPAFHWLDLEQRPEIPTDSLKVWMDVGEGEGYYVENSRKILDNLIDMGMKPMTEIAYYQVPMALHSESYWAERIHCPLLYLFGNIGKPLSCNLLGRREIGLAGMKVIVNPIIEFDSGFTMTDIDASYIVGDKDIMEISNNGATQPKKCGRTRITYEADGIKADKDYEIIPELSETVKVDIEIEIPETHTPVKERLYLFAGELIELFHNQQGIYQHSISIPRDWGYPVTILKGERHIGEADEDGNAIGCRLIIANDNVKLQWNVKNWIDC